MTTDIISKTFPCKNSVRFSIIIPTWNNLASLKLCMDSILKNSRFKHQIIIHINEGKDGTREWAEKHEIDYSYSSHNVGVCFAINSAAALAATDYIVYLNDDMYACPDWDYHLWEVIEQQSDHKFFLSSTSIEPRDANKKVAITHDFGTTPDNFRETELLQHYANFPMEDWCGASWPPNVVHRSIWQEVGGYSLEFFPGFYSDPDFSMKLWKAGVRRFKGVEKSRVYHFLEGSTKRLKNEAVTKANHLFLKKWGITAHAFYTYYLRMGQPYHELPEVKNSWSFLVKKLLCSLKRLFV